MPEKKYRVSGSAYGYGNLFGGNTSGFDDDFMSQYVTNDNTSYSKGMTALNSSSQMTAAPPTAPPAPTPTTPQVNQLAMGYGSDPRGNANDISNKAITGQTQGTPSVGMYGGGAPGTGHDDPFDTGSMAHFEDARNAPTGFNAYEQAMDQAGEDARLRGITSETYSATPLPGSNQSRDLVSGYGGRSAMGQADYDAAYGEGTRLDNNVAMRSVSTPSAGLPELTQVNEATDTYKNMVSSTADELIDEYKPAFIDERKIEEMARNNIGNQAFSEGGADLAWEATSGSGKPSIDKLRSFRPISSVTLPQPKFEGTLGQKLGSTLVEAKDELMAKGKAFSDKVSGVASKAATPLAMLSPIVSAIGQKQQRDKAIKGLRSSVSDLTSSIGNLANEEAAEYDAMFAEHTEKNRRIGANRNLQLGNKLDSVKGSNISSGSIKRIKKEITDEMGTSTDLDLAAQADSFDKQKNEYTIQSRANRSKMNEQLKQLQDQLKEEERQAKMAAPNLIADLGIAAISVANPMAGMALSAVKNKAMS